MINYEINQKIVPLRFQVKDVWVRRLMKAIEKSLCLRKKYVVSIAFVDVRTMRRLNRNYRGKDKVTDVLSFGNNEKLNDFAMPACCGKEEYLGELILAWPYVRNQAKDEGKTLEEELAFLIIHGMLHLRGYDHVAKSEARKMFKLQDHILKTL